MPKTTIKLPAAAASNIYLGVQSLQAAEQYFTSAAFEAKNSFVNDEMLHARTNIKIILTRIEKRIPKTHKDSYKEQIVNNDPLRIENMKLLYTRLTPEQQDIIEEIMNALTKGEEIKIEQSVSQ
jgi:Spy/CpxP family protein refolding chaperone